MKERPKNYGKSLVLAGSFRPMEHQKNILRQARTADFLSLCDNDATDLTLLSDPWSEDEETPWTRPTQFRKKVPRKVQRKLIPFEGQKPRRLGGYSEQKEFRDYFGALWALIRSFVGRPYDDLVRHVLRAPMRGFERDHVMIHLEGFIDFPNDPWSLRRRNTLPYGFYVDEDWILRHHQRPARIRRDYSDNKNFVFETDKKKPVPNLKMLRSDGVWFQIGFRNELFYHARSAEFRFEGYLNDKGFVTAMSDLRRTWHVWNRLVNYLRDNVQVVVRQTPYHPGYCGPSVFLEKAIPSPFKEKS